MKFKVKKITAKDRMPALDSHEAHKAEPCNHCGQPHKPPYWSVSIGGTSFCLCENCMKDNFKWFEVKK